jgi:glycosyltransferase involved in cell wall biosynthesis
MLTALAFGLPRLGKVDVVVASSPTLFSALSAWIIARVRRVPFVLEVRDLWPEAIVGLGLMRPGGAAVRILEALAHFLYRQAALVVLVTEAFADRLAQQGVPRRKLAVVPNGADTRLFSPEADGCAARAALGLDGRFVVAYIGSHGLSHGLGAVLDAATLQPDVTYLLVGDGAERARLLAERDRRGLSNVVMRPSVEKAQVPGLYAAADVCLVPLRDVPIFDAFVPSKLFELLAAASSTAPSPCESPWLPIYATTKRPSRPSAARVAAPTRICFRRGVTAPLGITAIFPRAMPWAARRSANASVTTTTRAA